MKIIDNYLDEETFTNISQFMMGSYFPWFYNDAVASVEKRNDLSYFTHGFFDVDFEFQMSSMYWLIQPLVNKIQPKDIIRVKGNLYPNVGTNINDPFHQDYKFEHKGAIFYINTNNGATIFEDGTRVESVANRILFFDPTIPHASCRCTDEKIRVNVNLNYI
jgi:hypothetical protein